MRDEQKDLLIQQYEEVALALLMEEYANAEGKRLLQEFETASAQGDIEPMPEELKAKYHKMIDQAYKKKRQRELFSGITKTVGKVAVVALMLFGIATTAILSVDAWRVPVLNFILDESGDSAIINIGYPDSDTNTRYEEILNIVCGHAPYGYTLTAVPPVDEEILLIKMKNREGALLNVTVSKSTSQITVDTENAEYTEYDLDGRQAYLIVKDGFYITWLDDTRNLIYSVYAQELSPNAFWALVNALAQ